MCDRGTGADRGVRRSRQRPPVSRRRLTRIIRDLAGLAYGVGLWSVLAAVSAAAQLPRAPDIHFTPTPQVVAEAMLDLAATGPDDVVVDLGSGDGRLVILAAQRHGAHGVGIELQLPLVALARASAVEAGVADRVQFVEGDLREADLSTATVVMLYLSTTLTREITAKLRRELRPGTRIVSHQFLLANWPPDRSVAVEGESVHLWIVPSPGLSVIPAVVPPHRRDR